MLTPAGTSHRSRGGLRKERLSYMVPQPKLTWLHCSGPGRRRRAHVHRKLPLGGSVSCREAESHRYRRKVFQREPLQTVWGCGMSVLGTDYSPDWEAVVWIYPLQQTVQLVEKR